VKYALLIYGTPETRDELGPEPDGAHDEWVAFEEATTAAGVFVAARRLSPAPSATTVRMSAGELLLTDGPFAETKEHLLGFYLIEVPDLAAAVGWAARMPVLRQGSVEIRSLLPESAPPRAGRASHRATA
jgi:hypothetical protein